MDRMEIIVKYNGDIERIAAIFDADAELLSEQYAILTIDRGFISELYSLSEIEDIELPRRAYTDSSYSLSASCITAVQEQTGFGLTGRGVIVAVIDSGIDYTHPDFLNPDGSSRILALWDMTIDGSPPSGFREGTEYTKEQIDAALQSNIPLSVVPSRDYAGHGTAVTGIAAGNGASSDGENRGAAPDADLLIVKAGSKGFDSFAMTTELMRALKYVTDKAQEFGRPAAINMSYGMNDGSHEGNSLFEEYIAQTAARWKTSVVIPTGNEGSAGHHYAGRLRNGEITTVEFFTASGLDEFYLSLWKNFSDTFAAELIFPGGRSSGIISASDPIKTVFAQGLTLTVFFGQPTRYNVDQEVFFTVTADSGTIMPGLWKLRIIPSEIVDGRFDLWLPTTEEVTDRTYFSAPSEEGTITIPATAEKVIRTAGYNDRTGSIAPFSGTGTRGGILPDIAAPAVNVISTRAGGGYDTFTGTSFAAPFVTGSAALMMEWGIIRGNAPFLYGERIKAYLRLGARRTAGMTYPNPFFGYGRLCLNSTMAHLSMNIPPIIRRFQAQEL